MRLHLEVVDQSTEVTEFIMNLTEVSICILGLKSVIQCYETQRRCNTVLNGSNRIQHGCNRTQH